MALVLAVLLPATAVGLAAAWHLAASYRSAFEDRLHDTAKALALYLDEEIESRLNAVASMAASPLLDRGDLPAFRSWAALAAEAMDGWVVVNDAAPGHQQILNTGLPDGAPLPPPAPPGEGAWNVIRAAIETQRPAISDLFIARGSGRAAVAVAAPVLRKGRVAQVVVLGIDPGRLAARLQEHAPSGDAYVSVADRAGRIVARSQDHERFIGTTPPSRSASPAERAEKVFTRLSVYGDTTLFSARSLRMAPGWSVVVGQPYARYRANWVGPLAVFATTAAGVLAVGLLIAAGLARRILRPVTALAQRGDVIAAGQAEPVQVPRASVAEFEALRISTERAEAALAAREAEFRAIFENAAAGVVEVDAASRRYLRVNRRFCDLVAREESELVGRLGPESLCRAGDRASIPILQVIEHGGEAEGEYGILKPDGTTVWVHASAAVSARDTSGRPIRVVSVLQDVTERRKAEEARELLAREVDHRAKNVLAVVQATLRLTPKTDVRAYAAAVEGRVTALARAQTLLADSQWTGADLASLAAAEIGPFSSGPDGAGGAEPSAIFAGPSITLSPTASQALAMTLHELGTNAIKHGALSRPTGRVSFTWWRDDGEAALCLRWAETGGPSIDGPPIRRGFGSRVIDGTINGQLGGTAVASWNASGLLWEARVPLSRALPGQGGEEPGAAHLHPPPEGP